MNDGTFVAAQQVGAELGSRDHRIEILRSKDDHFLSKNEKIAFGRPNGVCLTDGTILMWYWCTIKGVTHTRWTRVATTPP